MLLPMPAMPMDFGPPSEYAKSKRPLMFAILLAQSIVVLLRMFMLLDILGGFIMAIMAGIGWYAWHENVMITFTCYWGMMCFINGIFDVVKLIDHLVKLPGPLLSSELPWSYNLMGGTIIAIPLVTIPGAIFAYFMYQHHTASGAGVGMGQYNPRAERTPLWSAANNGMSTAVSGPGFKAFSGGGHRLGMN